MLLAVLGAHGLQSLPPHPWVGTGDPGWVWELLEMPASCLAAGGCAHAGGYWGELVPCLASLKGSWQWRMWLCAHPGEDFMLGQCGEMNPTGAHIQIPSSSSSAPFLSPISHHSLSPQPLPPQVPAEGTPWQCCHHGNDVPMLLTTPCPEGCRHLLSLPIHPPTVGVAPEAPPRSDPRGLSLSGHGGTPKILLVPLPWAVPPQLLRALHVP